MKPFPWRCAECRERAVSPAVLTSYEVEVEHDGRRYAVTVPDLDVLKCGNCAEIILDDAANERITEALRRKADLLLPCEIRQKREALGLTQKQVAASMQISESTLSRWETGFQIQQRCMDRFLRAFFDLEDLRCYLGVSQTSWGSEVVSAPTPCLQPAPQDVKDIASEEVWGEMAGLTESQPALSTPRSSRHRTPSLRHAA